MENNKTISDQLNIYNWTYEDGSLLKLKEWVDEQIKSGSKNVRVEVDYDRENYVDTLTLKIQ